MSIMDNPLPTGGNTDTWVKVALGALGGAVAYLTLRQKAHEECAEAAFRRIDDLCDRVEAFLPQPDPDPAETVEPVELEPEQPEATAQADAEPEEPAATEAKPEEPEVKPKKAKKAKPEGTTAWLPEHDAELTARLRLAA